MKEFAIVNKYESLFDSDSSEDDDDCSFNSYDYGDEDDYEFMIPEEYKGDEVHNTEMETAHEEVMNWEHEKKWKEEWLLDSGSTVNLTNRSERFWNQYESSVTVTVGEGSQVEGQKDRHVVLKEKNSGKSMKISATYCPNFRKNILSVKRLQLVGYSVSFEDTKAVIQDKKNGDIAFICEKGIDGMFYLRGTRDGMFYLRGTRINDHGVNIHEHDDWKEVILLRKTRNHYQKL
jgi:hypothetical protein